MSEQNNGITSHNGGGGGQTHGLDNPPQNYTSNQNLHANQTHQLPSDTLLTNIDSNTLLNRIEDLLSKNIKLKNIDILIGYFNPLGFNKIAKFIKPHHKVRILVGISAQEIKAKYQNPENENYINALIEQFSATIQSEDALKNFDSVESLKEHLRANLQMRMVKDKDVHAKMYIFSEEPSFSKALQGLEYSGELITGSSNLTLSGLEKNHEINVRLTQHNEIKLAKEIFEELWKDAIPITPDIIEISYPKATLKDAYYKMLIEYFEGKTYEDSTKDIFPKNYKPLAYQMDALSQAISILNKHNGVFLGDVVGLGKTLIALLIAQKLIASNQIKSTEEILIVHPATLENSWKFHTGLFGSKYKGYYTLCRHDMLHKIEPKDYAKYALVIIDESHRFRNSETNRYKNISPLVKSGGKKVILLSATPQNNSPKDIKNQLLLFLNDNTRIGNTTLKDFFSQKQKIYDNIKRELKISIKEQDQESISEAKKELRKMASEIKEQVLRNCMIRRTRSDLEKHYKDDLEKQNIYFPKSKLESLPYTLSPDIAKLCQDTLTFLKDEYKFARYGIYLYLNAKGREKFGENDKLYASTAERLQGLMRIQLFKRFESSFHAFKVSLKNQYRSLNRIITTAKDKDKEEIKISISEGILKKIYDLLDDGEIEKAQELMDEASGIVLNLDTDFANKKQFIADLENDQARLDELIKKWDEVKEYEDDSKFDEFVKTLENHKNSKIVVFTESISTADFLKKRLDNLGFEKVVLKVDSKNKDDMLETIAKNFDANYKDKDNKYLDNTYQILIATDALAEGINLHRANIIINYDAPWNSTRLMQRIGRINRIGTPHKEIFIRNFKPSSQGDKVLNLMNQTYQKLQTFHDIFGEDSAIYSNEEIVKSAGLFDKQLPQDEPADKELEKEQIHLDNYKKLTSDELELYKSKPSKMRLSTIADSVETPAHKFLYLQLSQTLDTHRFYTEQDQKMERVRFYEVADKLLADLKADAKTYGRHNDFGTFYDRVKDTLQSEIEASQISTPSIEAKNIIAKLNKAISAAKDQQSQKILKTIREFVKANQERKELLKDLKNNNLESTQALQDIIQKHAIPTEQKLRPKVVTKLLYFTK